MPLFPWMWMWAEQAFTNHFWEFIDVILSCQTHYSNNKLLQNIKSRTDGERDEIIGPNRWKSNNEKPCLLTNCCKKMCGKKKQSHENSSTEHHPLKPSGIEKNWIYSLLMGKMWVENCSNEGMKGALFSSSVWGKKRHMERRNFTKEIHSERLRQSWMRNETNLNLRMSRKDTRKI